LPLSLPLDWKAGKHAGYTLATSLGEVATTFVAWGRPILPGRTGSDDLRYDDRGRLISSPTPDADEARQAMFSNLHEATRDVLVGLFAEVEGEIDMKEIAQATNPRNLRKAFAEFDENGDGQIGVEEIREYKGQHANLIQPLLGQVREEMQFGLEGEDVALLPAVKYAKMLTRKGGPGTLSVKVGGWSQSLVGVPTVQMAMFGEGSVRTGGSFPLRQSSAFVDLHPGDRANLHSGSINFRDDRGNTLNGILIGLLLPASPTNPEMQFEGLVIAPDGTGQLLNAAGFGQITLGFEDGLSGPVDGRLKIAAPR